jgi:hypothetical protein
LTSQLEKQLGQAFVLSGRVDASYENLQKRTLVMNAELDKMQATVRSAAASAPAEPQRAASAVLSGSASLDGIERALGMLGSRRDGPTFTINNPSMGGADIAECPPGTFVWKVHASAGIGGKYATDGISQIKVTCAPVR